MEEYMIDLNEFAEGALAAKVNAELEKVLENIADPNTDPKKNRTITVSIKIHGDEKRDVLNTTVSTKVKLEPMKEVETKLMMGADNEGNIIGKELRSGVKGQMFLDNEGDVAQDDGEKVLNLREKRS
ncbi:replication terminator protein [Virgibacillus salexigens]|uniref:Replication terminator protein n=1 Tax=Virgibacillus kapii TaxID=1638645 RepID=A0ABQ2DNE9_9BACI|nr:replication terminator protein [Virgibacillus kapii]GGJ61785.1 replication terminator protein [Virgibacillus kapii]